jgi:myo-inositol-1(or 4)-monophosphatase
MFDRPRLKQIEEEMQQIILAAGKKIYTSWGKNNSPLYKDKRDIFTTIDIDIENEIRRNLQKILPEAGFIVEEGKSQPKEKYNWIIDPIDGTKNYVNKLPSFVTQAALTFKNNPVVGVIYHPISNQLFSASLGNGARLNGVKVIANTRDNPEESIIDVDFGGMEKDIEVKKKAFSSFINHFYRVRSSGGIFSTYIITGAIDAYVILSSTTKIVDKMPRIIVMREAGLRVEEITLCRRKNILVAANPVLFEKIKKMLIK